MEVGPARIESSLSTPPPEAIRSRGAVKSRRGNEPKLARIEFSRQDTSPPLQQNSLLQPSEPHPPG